MGAVFLPKYKALQGNHDLVNPSLVRGLPKSSVSMILVVSLKQTFIADHCYLLHKYTPQQNPEPGLQLKNM